MADYQDFANLWNADDEIIARFVKEKGPLGLEDWLYQPFHDDFVGPREPYPFFNYLPLLKFHRDLKEGEENEFIKETVENIREQATLMHWTIRLHEVLKFYDRDKTRESLRALCGSVSDIFNQDVINALPSEISELNDIPEESLDFVVKGFRFFIGFFILRILNQAILPRLQWKAQEKNGRFEIAAKSDCLLGSLWYNLAQDIMTNKVPRVCPYCLKAFAPKKASQQYCCPSHENAFKARRHREKQGATTRRGRPPKI